jgi:hypothetical protein
VSASGGSSQNQKDLTQFWAQESDSDEDGIAFPIDDKLTPRENAIAFTTQLQERRGVVSEDVPWAHHFEVESFTLARKKAILAGIGQVAGIIDQDRNIVDGDLVQLLREEGALDLAVAKCFHGHGEWDPAQRQFQGAPDWDYVRARLANLKVHALPPHAPLNCVARPPPSPSSTFPTCISVSPQCSRASLGHSQGCALLQTSHSRAHRGMRLTATLWSPSHTTRRQSSTPPRKPVCPPLPISSVEFH